VKAGPVTSRHAAAAMPAVGNLNRGVTTMTTNLSIQPKLIRRSFAASVAMLAITVAGAAYAGECPADKTGIDVTPASTADYRGVTDEVAASLDLAQHLGIDGRLLRLRRLEIAPGGVVGWHSHEDRPAIIYVLQGAITEYRSTCSVPIEHKAGEATPERKEASHWWRNNTKNAAVLLAADVARNPNDKGM
jgi:quercetin dioxygenase-like cupin family protein